MKTASATSARSSGMMVSACRFMPSVSSAGSTSGLRHLADILPMSGTTLSSGIGGIPISSARFGASIPRSGQTAESPTLW